MVSIGLFNAHCHVSKRMSICGVSAIYPPLKSVWMFLSIILGNKLLLSFFFSMFVNTVHNEYNKEINKLYTFNLISCILKTLKRKLITILILINLFIINRVSCFSKSFTVKLTKLLFRRKNFNHIWHNQFFLRNMGTLHTNTIFLLFLCQYHLSISFSRTKYFFTKIK